MNENVDLATSPYANPAELAAATQRGGKLVVISEAANTIYTQLMDLVHDLLHAPLAETGLTHEQTDEMLLFFANQTVETILAHSTPELKPLRN